MNRVELVNAVERLVEDFCADDVKDALAAVCAMKGAASEEMLAREWRELADRLNAVPNLGV